MRVARKQPSEENAQRNFYPEGTKVLKRRRNASHLQIARRQNYVVIPTKMSHEAYGRGRSYRAVGVALALEAGLRLTARERHYRRSGVGVASAGGSSCEVRWAWLPPGCARALAGRDLRPRSAMRAPRQDGWWRMRAVTSGAWVDGGCARRHRWRPEEEEAEAPGSRRPEKLENK
ncbi:hypothetical protein NDU88_000286 [Pleurodeles waltl]|uniref:Uncharacterized protein n=1 Tax=Pleurodeles waltl TaxID=8319 RepID=A0AAV7SWJ7_PLEWA|nr:hypothetical protein NDU88_000286 [Pleurodeles waltl]